MIVDGNDPGAQPTLAIVAPDLVQDITTLIDDARKRAAQHINTELTELYWRVGKRLALEVLGGERGDYGKQVIASLALELTARHGRGWSAKQLRHCLRFAEVFPAEEIVSTLWRQLSWSHLRRHTSLPPREVLQQRLHEAVHNARARLAAREDVEKQ